ncbi:MAG: tryptophan synthase subunit beta, partial [Pseudomonadota bacterium]
MSAYDLPDTRGHFGPYGGMFVSETLMQPLAELRKAYEKLRNNAKFNAEFADDLRLYVGRPSPLYPAKRLSAAWGGAKIYLKR